MNRIQANKQISCYRLAQDINVPQNLRGLLECGVQVDLDQDKKVEGTDNVLLEAVVEPEDGICKLSIRIHLFK
jgi:hypothetical protein